MAVTALCPSFIKNILLCNACRVRTKAYLIVSQRRSIYTKSLASQFKVDNQYSTTQNSVKHRLSTHEVVADDVKCDASSFHEFQKTISDGPSLKDFIAKDSDPSSAHDIEDVPHYIDESEYLGRGRKVFFETYGCQMNVNDTEIAWTFLRDKGFFKTSDVKTADVVLVMTCSIREGAEQKIWNRLVFLKSLKKKRPKRSPPLQIGVLGCMAERLKEKLIEKEKMVDVVCGPDAYRDLPRLLSVNISGHPAVNVQLSLEETYADIVPVRLNTNTPSAFVSIMRGCDNMCTYCIVPFTRGRERSRPIDSIVEEVKILSQQGIKEVTLLGQNVNSYRDLSQTQVFEGYDSKEIGNMSRGFKTVYKPKKGGRRFSDLLDKISLVDPEMRIRFTSPHPKDFPDEVLDLINGRSNICNQIHLPAQSGSSRVLEAMRRGYTREAYLDLVQHIKETIPNVSLTSDFIAGFCGETEDDHQETLSLMEQVKYNFAFCFPYSMRQKTRAYHKLKDDVPEDVKARRHKELHEMFRQEAAKLNAAQIGQIQLVLVEGVSKRSENDVAGRNDGNTKVILPQMMLPEEGGSADNSREMVMGDYVVARIIAASSQVLKGIPLCHTSLGGFSKSNVNDLNLRRAEN